MAAWTARVPARRVFCALPQSGGGESSNDELRAQAARAAADTRALPDTPYDLTKLRSMDTDVRLHAQRILSLRSPLVVGGTFKDPSFRPEFKRLGLRSAAALALTTIAPPAALLATIETGPGEDSGCGGSYAKQRDRHPGQSPSAQLAI